MTKARPARSSVSDGPAAEYVTVVARASGELLKTLRGSTSELLGQLEARTPLWESMVEIHASLQAALDLNEELVRCCGMVNFQDELMPDQTEAVSPPAVELRPDDGAAPVLVVERDDGLRCLMAEVLRKRGFRVVVARTGAEAWQTLAAGRTTAAAAVMEMLVDGASGVSLAARLRARKPDLRVVYTVSESQEAMIPEGALGDDLLLTKPFNVAGLVQAVTGVYRR